MWLCIRKLEQTCVCAQLCLYILFQLITCHFSHLKSNKYESHMEMVYMDAEGEEGNEKKKQRNNNILSRHMPKILYENCENLIGIRHKTISICIYNNNV